jgi:hypothetical protein
MKDLNAHDIKEATKIICGSARSMGIEVKDWWKEKYQKDLKMFSFFWKKEKELITKFGSFYSDNFTKEFIAFLMTKCEPYMKWTASQLN